MQIISQLLGLAVIYASILMPMWLVVIYANHLAADVVGGANHLAAVVVGALLCTSSCCCCGWWSSMHSILQVSWLVVIYAKHLAVVVVGDF